MSCSSFSDHSSPEQEPLVYLEMRKTILGEYKGFVREKAAQIRSSTPALSAHLDMAEGMTHEFVRHAWTSYVERAEQRFGKEAVALALRDIVPL